MTTFWARLTAGTTIFAILAALTAFGPFGAVRLEPRLQKAAEARAQSAAPSAMDPVSPPPETESALSEPAAAPIEEKPRENGPADCQAAISRTLNGRRLAYRHESARLSADNRALLDEFARALADCKGQTIAIEGHTDATGSEVANLALSEKRANAVKDYLGQADLGAALVIRAYGESRPIASNQSAAGRAANRRIDFVAAGLEAESD